MSNFCRLSAAQCQFIGLWFAELHQFGKTQKSIRWGSWMVCWLPSFAFHNLHQIAWTAQVWNGLSNHPLHLFMKKKIQKRVRWKCETYKSITIYTVIKKQLRSKLLNYFPPKPLLSKVYYKPEAKAVNPKPSRGHHCIIPCEVWEKTK